MQALFNWNFRLYRLFGIDVRIHWTLPLFMAVEILQWAKVDMADYGAYLMLGLFCGILIHEYGHCIAARLTGAGADSILMWPLGGLAMVGHSHTNRGDIFVAFSGPAFGILVCGLCLGLAGITDATITWNQVNPFGLWGTSLWLDILKINIVINALNLIAPVYPLDGGRILTGLLAYKIGYARALLVTTFTGLIFGMVCLGVGLYYQNFYTGIFGVWVVISCIIARTQLKMGAVPEYASPYAESLDSDVDRPPRLGFFARWRIKREAKRRARQKESERQMREEVDVILDKVKREGMDALSPKERAALNEASKRMRDSEG